jgi:transcription initiation factor TFIIIB Brf1 subunit/transcription initiation factor TFIIB
VAVFCAVIFLACRQTGYPRTFKEICATVPQAEKKVRPRPHLRTPLPAWGAVP